MEKQKNCRIEAWNRNEHEWTWYANSESGDSSVFMMILTYVLHLLLLPPPSRRGKWSFQSKFATKNIIILVVSLILFWGVVPPYILHQNQEQVTSRTAPWQPWCDLVRPQISSNGHCWSSRRLNEGFGVFWCLMLSWICVALGWYGCVGVVFVVVVVVVVLVGIDSCCVVLQEKCKTAKESVASNRRQRQEIGIPVLQPRFKTSAEPPEMYETLWKKRDILNFSKSTGGPISSLNSISWCGVCKMSASLKRRVIFHLKEEVWKASW